MGLNERIPLLGRGIDTATPLQRLGSGLAEKRQNDEAVARQQEQQAFEREQIDLDRQRQETLDAQNQGSREIDDNLAREQLVNAEFQNLNEREQSRIRNVAIAAAQVKPFLDSGDTEGALNFAQSRLAAIQARMGTGEGIDDEDTAGFIDMLQNGDIEGAKMHVDALVQVGQMTGALKVSGVGGATGELISRLSAENPDMTELEILQQIRGGAGQRGKNEANIETGRDAEKEKEIGKVTGAETGAAIAKFEDFKAALPGMQETTQELYKLAEAATFTSAGKFSNAIKRQLGVDVGDAGEARAKLETIIRVEVLPLLKPTFGAAFTVREGEWLLATLGDPDSSPDEKKAQIDARIEGWIREGNRLAARVGEEPPENMFPGRQDGQIKFLGFE